MSVVQLRKTPNPKVVEMIEKLLEQAKQGEFQNMAVISEMTNGVMFTQCKGGFSVALIGEMHIFTNELAEILNNSRKVYD